ncbi:hypothetical protein F511_45246 [Dorcoceras hygrometricum]|uniref:Uncharacterized protein n=1 Tax=Dorcoceras hygrometricum TaxID=472368 RepID=A0A2Z6ZXR1_9LAMI|nr:hypothetical protein F511_45246 [Dorcoceras hygrometricum]
MRHTSARCACPRAQRLRTMAAICAHTARRWAAGAARHRERQSRMVAGHRHCNYVQLQCRRAHATVPPCARYSAAAPGSDQIHRESGTSTVGGGRSPNPVHDWKQDSFVSMH